MNHISTHLQICVIFGFLACLCAFQQRYEICFIYCGWWWPFESPCLNFPSVCLRFCGGICQPSRGGLQVSNDGWLLATTLVASTGFFMFFLMFPESCWLILYDWNKIDLQQHVCILYSMYIYNFKTRPSFDTSGYNFYIDNMPTDDVQQLNGDQTDWLRRAASWCRVFCSQIDQGDQGPPRVTFGVNERDQLVGKHFFLWLWQFWYFRFVWSRVEVKTGRPGNVDVAELEVIMQEVQLDFARAMNLGTLRRVSREMQCKNEQSCRIESVFLVFFSGLLRNKVTFDTHVLQAWKKIKSVEARMLRVETFRPGKCGSATWKLIAVCGERICRPSCV